MFFTIRKSPSRCGSNLDRRPCGSRGACEVQSVGGMMAAVRCFVGMHGVDCYFLFRITHLNINESHAKYEKWEKMKM